MTRDARCALRPPAAAREPDAAGRRLQLFAGAGGGGRGGHRDATRRAPQALDRRRARAAVAAHARRRVAGGCCAPAATGDRDAVARWNDEFLAQRASRAELRAETRADGRLAAPRSRRELEILGRARAATRCAELSLSRGLRRVRAAPGRSLPRDALAAYLWAWLREPGAGGGEGRAARARPTGSACCSTLGARMPAVVASARAGVADDDLGNFAPGLALAVSARHETQYTRLFRS